jgi:hypothetical protein
MFALHAGFSTRHLIVWGETSVTSEHRAKRGGHPLGAGPERLVETLGSLGIRIASEEAITREILLPSVRSGPVPSSPLIANMPLTEDVKIAPWKVTTAEVAPPVALDLLCLQH